jgi:hypothetical protein
METLKVPGSCCRYRFSAFADDTIFCTCFALFILDLFKETDRFTDEHRQKWISHIQGFQNEKHGYFEPEKYYHKDKERNCYQLTCFCLSALGILGAEPQYPLRFLNQWKAPSDIKKYLYEKGCHQGVPGSGNKAMFLAIFLTYEYERTKENHLNDKINAWFEFHNETQNRNGFWGADLKSHYLHGLQNGFHQFVIYFYWRREIPKINKIVDVALMSQDKQGFFAPTLGGEACHDYDAVHILAMARRTTDYRKDEIEVCLRRAFDAILSTQNSEGGFCQSKCMLAGLTDFFRYIPIYLSNSTPYLWYYRARSCLRTFFKQDKPVYAWAEKGRSSQGSNLWDTWFRCLTLADIENTLDSHKKTDRVCWKFHKTIGLGYF